MRNIIQPLKESFKVDEDVGYVAEQIVDRVNAEDNLTWSLGWPIIKSTDIHHEKMRLL